jgi:hypothetical protein
MAFSVLSPMTPFVDDWPSIFGRRQLCLTLI